MSCQIFISYHRRGKGAEIADLFYTMLHDSGYRVFMDTHTNIGHEKWKLKQDAEIYTARDFLLIVTKGDLEALGPSRSAWLWEIGRAVFYKEEYEAGRHERPMNIILMCESGCSWEFHSEDLPNEIQRLTEENYIPIDTDYASILNAYKRLKSPDYLSCKPETYSKANYRSNVVEYDSSTDTERRRLQIQADFSEKLDKELFEKARRITGKEMGMTALDVGCADGYVTTGRLIKENGFSQVVGIDYNRKNLTYAKKAGEEAEAAGKGSFAFHFANLVKEDFRDQMMEIMDEEKISSFDVIYSTFTLHHLSDDKPVAVLRTLNDFLSPNGVVILRGIDDGAQLFHVVDKDCVVKKEESDLLKNIVRDTLKIGEVSNRLHGRAFYSWLKSAGYMEIESAYLVSDTVGLSSDDRLRFMQYNFDFRKRYAREAAKRDPRDPKRQKLRQRLGVYVDDFQTILGNDDNAYYMIVEFGMVAKHFEYGDKPHYRRLAHPTPGIAHLGGR